MKYIAFYFPQFHSIEENNQWWGHQFTDWELVQAAQQYAEEQRQPRIPLNNNYYNLTEAEVIAWQTLTTTSTSVSLGQTKLGQNSGSVAPKY